VTSYLPLLHVAETVVRVTVLDGRVLCIGVLLLVAATAAIWWPRHNGRVSFRRRHLRRVARAGVLALAFFAVLPSVLPYDHLIAQPHAGHEDSHALHCHGAPGECADAPIPAGPGQMIASEALVAVPAMLSLILVVTILPLVGLTRRPELRPPLASPSF
jgi:hypothetical protein